ncbi:unnamed protein product [Adineta steineri]|uniref:Uncharacterized protein n=1 Tax=Adineta steineri TaxID=433720 RepID=A0A814RJK3_9BILA|nr:unnamed protein product [Adineta steineri]CAF1132255.1 unnamed protein product [Adineta steineri]CAF1134278.1 unnamed protein product [Adineta steineri]
MTKSNSSSQRNVEYIRRKNVEDNQVFLQNLLITTIRNDFVKSARSILHTNRNNQSQKNLQQQKVEHITRYREKVKSGEIGPYVPEWQRHLEEKKKEAEKRLLEKEQKKLENERKRQERLLENERKREEQLFEEALRQIERKLKMEEKEKIRLARQRPPKPTKWALYDKEIGNSNRYQRIFKPRHTKVGERIQQNLF